MKILILGGQGLVGSYLYKELKQKHEVDFTTSLDSKDAITYNVKTDNLKDIISQNYDLLINNINPQSFTYAEVAKCIEQVCNFITEKEINLLHISSAFAQLNNRNENPYSLKKAIAEDIILQELPKEKYTILRFPQLFDKNGLARKSQAGLYYLLDAIKKQQPITLFSNYEECFRNYMPVELLIQTITTSIDNELKGVFNAYLTNFTLSFDELLDNLITLNPSYDKSKLVSIGQNKGMIYHLESANDQLIEKITFQNPLYYFKEAYTNL